MQCGQENRQRKWEPMTREHRHNPTVKESVGRGSAPPADLEAAWTKWSSRLQIVDERAMSLLRGQHSTLASKPEDKVSRATARYNRSGKTMLLDADRDSKIW